MIKPGYKNPLLYSLITALLFLQWSSTHIHLAGEHEHNGDPHHHSATAHQHQIASHHLDVIDAADTLPFHADSHSVIELEHVCTKFHGNLGKLFAVLPAVAWKSSARQNYSKLIIQADSPDTHQSYNQYTSIRLRAPPLIS